MEMQKVLNERLNVFWPLTQRREINNEDFQAIEKIIAEVLCAQLIADQH